MIKTASNPFDSPKLRNILIDIHKRNEQIIDTITTDELISAEFDEKAKEKSTTIIDTFKKFIEENKNEVTALQILYNKPYSHKQIALEDIQKLADTIKKPPYLLNTDILWKAYEQLEKSKVRKVSSTRLLTDIISLIRFTTGQDKVLEPFSETVNEKFEAW